MYSAIKRAGVPLYKLARQGAEPEPAQPRRVKVKWLELSIEAGDRLRFSLCCATGMYVRSLGARYRYRFRKRRASGGVGAGLHGRILD